MMRGSRHIAGSWVCCVFRFDVCCVVFIVSGCRKEKNERHFAWLLIALLVCRNLILYVCDCFSLVFVWHLSFLFAVWWSHLQLWWCLDIRGLGHVHVVLSGGIEFFFFFLCICGEWWRMTLGRKTTTNNIKQSSQE